LSYTRTQKRCPLLAIGIGSWQPVDMVEFGWTRVIWIGVMGHKDCKV